jgi:glycosyltransferase involved in cell wall biosynthesis
MVAPFPPPYGGIADYAENLCRGLGRAGVAYEKIDTARHEDLRPKSRRGTRNYLRILNPGNLRLTLATLGDFAGCARVIRRFKPDVVHVHTASFWSWWRSSLYLLLARQMKVKTILHVHNAIDRFYFQESGLAGRLMIRRSLRLPDCVITLSQGIKAIVGRLTPRPIIPVYNGIDVQSFINHKVFAPPFKVLFAGFVGHEKGVPDLLAALRASGLRPSEMVLTIMGRGQVEQMAGLATQYGLDGQVNFTGQVSEAEKQALFKSYHILALPSYGEGQPIVILEGMASGMAILSTRVGSIPEVVQEGVNGCLVQAGDVAGLARGLRQLASAHVLQAMGRTNEAEARAKYDYGRVLEDVVRVYQSVIA